MGRNWGASTKRAASWAFRDTQERMQSLNRRTKGSATDARQSLREFCGYTLRSRVGDRKRQMRQETWCGDWVAMGTIYRRAM